MYRRHVLARMRLSGRRLRRFIIHDVLHADDHPYRLALGAAIGVFVTITPTIGLQMTLALILAWALRANKALAVLATWVSNPVTIVPIFYGCYAVGVGLTGGDGVDPAWWAELADPPNHLLAGVRFYWGRFMEVAGPLWIGCAVVAVAAGAATYFCVYHTVRVYRLRRWGCILPPPIVRRGRAPRLMPRRHHRGQASRRAGMAPYTTRP